MIDKINELVEKINVCGTELASIEKDVLETEMERLNRAVQIALKGIKFSKIYSVFNTYNNNNNWCEDEYNYYKNENGKFKKGVIVGIIELSYNSYSTGGNKSEMELFLMNDGTFMVFNHTAEWSNWQDDVSKYRRTVSENKDVSQFDFDSILYSIIIELNSNLENMGTRKKTQTNRLQKLKVLRIDGGI